MLNPFEGYLTKCPPAAALLFFSSTYVFQSSMQDKAALHQPKPLKQPAGIGMFLCTIYQLQCAFAY